MMRQLLQRLGGHAVVNEPREVFVLCERGRPTQVVATHEAVAETVADKPEGTTRVYRVPFVESR